MSKKSPRILVTNDDGIHAEGLVALEKIARTLSDDVWVVAPEQEQSGAGHSLTLHVPVRVRKIEAKRFAVSGTPTDCVLLALKQIIGKKVDLVLSGVNRGSNVGDDVTYSGTIAAAMEGTLLGVPSMAFSQLYNDRENVPYDIAVKYAPKLIAQLLAQGWPAQSLININFPKTKVKGVRVCPQGKRLVNVALSERADPRGRPYFWLGGDREDKAEKAGVDIDLLNKGYITVTPIRMDMTDYEALGQLKL